MKKIGILTFHRAENYGAVLQAYALQKKLDETFGNTEIIDYRDENIESPYKLFYIKNKSFKGKVKTIISDFLFLIKNLKRRKAFERFYNKNIKMSKSFYKIDDFKDNYDVYITGSDQVWNSSITGGLSEVYTLNFKTNNAKKISYAASIGNSNIEESQKNIYKNKISQIDAISVREEEAKKELNSIVGNEINVVLDPTLLFTKEEWDEEIKDFTNINEKYILAYVITPNEEYLKIVNDLSEKTGLKILHFGKRNPGYKNVLKSMYTANPLEFVNLIKNAEYVVATSFHATVFSIIYNKKFFIIPHKKTGSRVTNILNLLNLQERICYSYTEFSKKDYNLESNWKEINAKLQEERNKSIKWIEEAIKS